MIINNLVFGNDMDYSFGIRFDGVPQAIAEGVLQLFLLMYINILYLFVNYLFNLLSQNCIVSLLPKLHFMMGIDSVAEFSRMDKLIFFYEGLILLICNIFL